MPENFHIDMPEAVRNIIHTIEEHGFKAYGRWRMHKRTVSLDETQMTGI